MPNLRFTGRILPKIAIVNFPDVTNRFGPDDLGFPILMNVTIRDSKVEVNCEVERFEEGHIDVLLGRAEDLVHACVDLGCFATGVGLLVEIDMIVRPDGTSGPILKQDERLGKLCTAFNIPPVSSQQNRDFELSLKAVLSDPALQGSLYDLSNSLVFYHQRPTNFGRVLDSLRKSVAPGLEPKKGWEVLKGIVNVEGDYMAWVSEYSKNSRHGDRTMNISKDVIDEMGTRTWNVVNRMIEFRKRGNQPLPLDQFPSLKSTNVPS
jgi:hypothetical protein